MLNIAFLGDFAVFANGTLKGNWEKKFCSVAEKLKSYDLVVINLEVPITDAKSTYVCKGIHLKTSEKIIDVLKFLHVGAVCLGNNHICDYGIRGMTDTIKQLEDNKIPYYGVNGKSLSLTINNDKINLHGYCCYSSNGAYYRQRKKQKGVNTLTRGNVIQDLKEDKKIGAFSILSFHWGDEYSQLPNERLVCFFEELAKDNSFIIHGHHTHAMQGIQQTNNALSIYSQGNFCFDEVHSEINPQLHVLQNDVNNESFIADVKIEHARIINWTTCGIMNQDNSFCIIDNAEKIAMLSNKIANCKEQVYRMESLEMIKAQKERNLGKKDIHWLINKLNYYSIGAKVLSYLHNYLYKKSY